MKIIFFGTSDFAAQIFFYLVEHHISIAAIVTQPDRQAGRNLRLTSSAVKNSVTRLALTVPLFQPEKASDPLFLEELERVQADLFVVVAYGQILPRKLLAIPPLGCINVHASLLPKYRGAAPIHRALLNGERETGVCVQQMVYQLDAGDVIDEAKTEIAPEWTFGELHQRLADLAKPLLLSVLHRYQQGIPPAKPQDPLQVTYAPKMGPEEAEIRWQEEADSLHHRIRALSPRPGAWCWISLNRDRKRLKILRAAVSPRNGSPGELLVFQGNTCIVAAQTNSLQLLQVQPEGKKPMAVADWIRGCQFPPQFI